MIEFEKTKATDEEIFELLHPLLADWFRTTFGSFTEPQKYAIPNIHNKQNTLITAPTGTGKCITPDSTILVNFNGEAKLLTGFELIELAKQGNFVSNIDTSGKLFKLPSLKSYSFSKGEIIRPDAMVYFEDFKGGLFKIKTEYGREIKLTADHPLLVETESGMKWKPSKEIKVGDKIAVPRRIELPEKEILLNYKKAISFVKKWARNALTFEDFARLKKKTKNFSDFSRVTEKDLMNAKTLLRISYLQIAKKIGIGITTTYYLFKFKTDCKREELYDFLKQELKKIDFKENQIIIENNGSQVDSFFYPKKLDSRAIKWVSFILSEGLIGNYKNGAPIFVSQRKQKGLLKEFLTNTKDLFGLSFVKKRGSDKDYALNSMAFGLFAAELFSIKRGKGRNVKMPPWLLNCTKKLKSDFLKVFFSLEAEARSNEIRLIQANKNKIETICYVLLSFGIIPSIGCTKKFATNTVNKTKRKYYFLDIRNIENLRIFLQEVGIIHEKAHLLKMHLASKPSGIYVKKHKFDYKKISSLSKHYPNYEEFCKDFKNILEVTRRTGYVTEDALKSTKNLLLKINSHENSPLLELINEKLGCNICWLKVKEKRKIKYKGKLVDLTVPKFENFVGGYGGIYLHNTLSAFTSIINELLTLSEASQLEDKVYCIYISPLRALSRDIEINLNDPLEAIKQKAEKLGKKIGIRVAVRTGDTTTSERAAMLKKVPHILITTPESFALLLNSPKFIEHFRQTSWVIIDEIHSLAPGKRGVHLSLSLERLQRINENFCRIGLSATIAPLEEIAGFLVGMKNQKEARDCKIVDVQFLKKLDLKVLSPLPHFIETSKEQIHEKLYNLIHELVQEHKTTLVFTNTRSATERVVHNLKDLFPKHYSKANLEAHHSSVSREQRLNVEERLKKGKLKCVVSSTSLELGIDIGFIDLVLLLGSPKSVSRALQRMGRSGHHLHDTIKGRIIVLDRDDLVECSVLLKHALEHHIDKIGIPENCLDVLAQQIFGIAINAPIHEKELFETIRHSYCYKNLSKIDFDETIKYLSGHYSSLETRHVYAKIWFDEKTGMIGKRGKLARVLYMTNIGTIPDEARIEVKIGMQKIGTIDEIFLEHLRKGDVFVLGGESYEFKFSRGNTAQVAPAFKRPPTVPSWFSEMLPLSFDLASEIQKFRLLMEEKLRVKKTKQETIEFINSYLYVDKNSANAIFEYFREQFLYAKIPSSKNLVIEHYSEEEKKFAIFHTLYGRRVNDALSRAFAYLLGRLIHKDIEITLSDNGFVLAAPKLPLQQCFSLLQKNKLREIAELSIENSEIMSRRFRHCATRALMILRSYKGKTKTVGRQQMHSRLLLSAVKRIGNDFPILKETRREILEDLMDIKNSELVISKINSKEIKIIETNSESPSPFAFNLFAQGYSDVLRMEGRIDFVKRMHEKVMQKIAKAR